MLTHDRSLYKGIMGKVDELPHVVKYSGPYSPQVYQAAQQAGASYIYNAPQSRPGGYNVYGKTYSSPTVLGSSSTTGGGTNQQVPTSTPPAGGGGGVGPAISDSDISEMYAPALRLADEAEGTAQSEYGVDVKNISDQITQQQQRANEDQNQLLADTDTEETNFNKVLRSAFEDAVRAYNSLAQQGNARFGRGSSAGQAVGELAQQEFFRQQGKVTDRQTEGNLQFAGERGKIRQFVKRKLEDLDTYKTTALNDLKKNLNDRLAEIRGRKADIEANKTRDRLAVLQDAISQTRAIQSADRQFRQNLGLAAVSKMQEISGRAFSPAEIKATLAEFMSDLPDVAPGSTPQAGGAVKKTTGINDELSSLVNPFQG